METSIIPFRATVATPPRPQDCNEDLDELQDSRIDALYLHIPFCFHKCHYCDFYSLAESTTDRHVTFVDALSAEFGHWAQCISLRPRSIFFGGGTPTLLSVEAWNRLLRRLDDTAALAAASEITVEANPETVTTSLMQTLAAHGVNRVSIGAQSFVPSLLHQLERRHDPASVPRAADIVRGAGITNLNLDLIFAIPGQTLKQLDADLERALALEPQHLSCYSLIYEPGTPLEVKLRQGRIARVDEALERQMYAHVMQRLDAAGFEHYEISNWARRGAREPASGGGSQGAGPPVATASPYRCLHHLLYWHNANWLGFGPSAASHVNGRRWKNEAHLGRYLAGSPDPAKCEQERLPPPRRRGEQIMLALRLREGISRAWWDAHLPAEDPRHETARHLIQLGMLEETGTHLRLTEDGLFVADSVIAQLV